MPDIQPPPQDIISSLVVMAPSTEPQTDSQQAFTEAAKKLLKYDRTRALEKYPELVHMPEE